MVTAALVATGLFASALGLAAIARSTARRRSEPGMAAFSVLTALLAAAALGAALVTTLGTAGFLQRSGPDVWMPVSAIGFAAAVPWVVFTVQYTGRGSYVTRARLGALCGLAGLHVLLLPAYLSVVPPGQMFPQQLDSPFVVTAFFADFMVLLALMALYAGGAVLLLRTTYAYGHMSAAMGLGLAGPGLALTMLWIFLPQVGLGYGFVASGGGAAATLLVTTACFGIVLRRDDAFGSTSAAAGPVGRDAILADLSDATFTLDDQHRVVECNEAARETFGLSEEEPLGEPVEEVLGACVDDLTTDAPLGVNTVDDLWTESTVFLETADGRRRFQVQVSDLTDEGDRLLGLVISLEDVTDRALREQRIGILNRVLRHNLRNKLSIVRGHAEMVPDAGDDLEEYAAAIESAASDLLKLGERAREVERLLAVEADASAAVRESVESVAADVRAEWPAAIVEVDVEDGLAVSTPWEALSFVLEELCENAVKHNDAAEPRVAVGARRQGDWVELTVVDDGPSLSEQELVAVDGDSESPLEHGSGLGLWSVRWVVTAFGGQLTVTDNDDRGSEITVLLPVDGEDEAEAADSVEDALAGQRGAATAEQ